MERLVRALMLAATLSLAAWALPAGAIEPPAPRLDAGCIRPVVRTATPVGVTGCPGVRPGAYIIVPSQGAGCTAGFVFTDSYKRWYITTAGHCVFPGDPVTGQGGSGRKVWPEGYGPVVTDGSGKPFGRFVFAALDDVYDIGVILISKGITPKASVCHFGGPTSVTNSRTSDIVGIEHYGNGIAVGDILPARSGVAIGMEDPYMVYGNMPSIMGDSGGPVVTARTGKAVGYVTAIGVVIGGSGGALGLPYGTPIWIHRLGPQMALAQKMLKRTLKLKTAPHSPSPVFLINRTH